MKNYVVSEALLQAILKYLGSRPYADVFELVQGIQNTVKVLEAAPAADAAPAETETSA